METKHTQACNHVNEYLCGCREECGCDSELDHYYDHHCARCHRELWTGVQ